MNTIRAKFRPSRALVASVKAQAKEPSAAPRRTKGDRLARSLALAHHIERLIEAGEVASYGEVGRLLGLSQPRISQIMGILFLAPEVQEEVLLDGTGMRVRDLPRAGAEASWQDQLSQDRKDVLGAI